MFICYTLFTDQFPLPQLQFVLIMYILNLLNINICKVSLWASCCQLLARSGCRLLQASLSLVSVSRRLITVSLTAVRNVFFYPEEIRFLHQSPPPPSPPRLEKAALRSSERSGRDCQSLFHRLDSYFTTAMPPFSLPPPLCSRSILNFLSFLSLYLNVSFTSQ